jgi:hypothetical protein
VLPVSGVYKRDFRPCPCFFILQVSPKPITDRC